MAVAHTNLGGAYTRLGEYEPALAHYSAAAPIYAAAGYRVGDVDTLCGLGLLYLRFDRYEEALDHLRRAVAAAQSIGELDVQARAFVGIGDTLRALAALAKHNNNTTKPLPESPKRETATNKHAPSSDSRTCTRTNRLWHVRTGKARWPSTPPGTSPKQPTSRPA